MNNYAAYGCMGVLVIILIVFSAVSYRTNRSTRQYCQMSAPPTFMFGGNRSVRSGPFDPCDGVCSNESAAKCDECVSKSFNQDSKCNKEHCKCNKDSDCDLGKKSKCIGGRCYKYHDVTWNGNAGEGECTVENWEGCAGG